MNNQHRNKKKTSLWKNVFPIIGGICLTFILFDIGMRISENRVLEIQDFKNTNLLNTGCDYRILCIGESTTQGEYPPLLEKILNKNDTGIKVCVFDEGIMSATTSTILAKLEGNLNRYKPNMVIAMLGINESNIFINKKIILNSEEHTKFLTSSKIYISFKLLLLRIQYKLSEIKICLKYYLKFKNNSLKDMIHVTKYNMTHKNILQRKIQSLQNDSKRSKIYNNLKKIYQLRNQPWREKAACYIAVEEDPLNVWNWFDLAHIISDPEEKQLIYDTISLFLVNALQEDPQNKKLLEYYRDLGWFFIGGKKYLLRGGEILDQIIKVQPSVITYACLGRYWMLQNNFQEAESMYQKALQLDPTDSFVWTGLAVLSEQEGDISRAELCRQKASQYRTTADYQETTIKNYLEIKDMITKRNIKLIAVQYPLRKLQPLKEVLNNDPHVIFVSNELSFKKAMANAGYSEYFRDIFAGDFGHCTNKGNQLIADNIAEAVLAETSTRS